MYFFIDIEGIRLLQKNIPKVTQTNKALDTLKFPVSFSLTDKNKYPMSTNY